MTSTTIATTSIFHSVDVGDGSSFRPWHIVDMSADGARLRVDGAIDVPDHFTLLVKGDVVKMFKCKVAWRSASHVGVTFRRTANPPRDCA